MTEKISEHKASRILQFFLEGYSEVSIAQKLKVTQSTVSLYIHRFKEAVDSQGLEKIGKERGIMDRLQSLHDLGAELQKEKLTIEEAKTALRVHSLLQGYGIGEERYSEVILACNKMHSASFAAAAQELATMEKTTGLNHQALMQQYHTANDNIVTTKKKLSALKAELNHAGHGLSDMKKKKRLAAKELESHLDNLGLDMKRLERVETLALALKKTGVGEAELAGYIDRQSQFQKTGVSPDIFGEILEQVRVQTKADQGKELLQMLSEYKGLAQTIKEQTSKIKDMEEQASVLEEKRKLVVKIRDDLKKLRAEEAI